MEERQENGKRAKVDVRNKERKDEEKKRKKT